MPSPCSDEYNRLMHSPCRDETEELGHQEQDRRRGSRPISTSSDQQRPKSSLTDYPEKPSFNEKPSKKRRLLLPWPLKYVAWALCLSIIGVSGFMLWAYAVQFGNEKTYRWFRSMISAFFGGLVILEPVKVLFLTFIYSCICKKVDLDYSDVDEDEERENIVYFEEDEDDERGRKFKAVSTPIDEETLEWIRKKRRSEVEMWNIFR